MADSFGTMSFAVQIRSILFVILATSKLATAAPQGNLSQPHVIPISGPTGDSAFSPTGVYIDASKPHSGPNQYLSPAFLSYSIEFSSFPDFAGSGVNGGNTFSTQLLSNIEAYQGVKPYIRVGGKTQDMALYWGVYGANVQSPFDHKQGAIGPDSPPDTDLLYTFKFFESYSNLPTKFIHGLNLFRTCGYTKENLKAGLNTAHRYLNNKTLLAFELGNEPEAYPHACIPSDAEPSVRPGPWNRDTYVKGWQTVAQDLLEVFPTGELKFIGPSIANGGAGFDPLGAYENGIDHGSLVNEFAGHSYISQTADSSVSLKGSLMNHTNIVRVLSPQLQLAQKAASKGLPFVLSQVNNIGQTGVKDVSDTFGAALSALDFALYAAAGNVSRVHMHQVGGAPLSAWHPGNAGGKPREVLPVYYAHLATAAMVGPAAARAAGELRIVHLPPTANASGEDEVAYAAYERGRLARVMLINMKEHGGAASAADRKHSRHWVLAPGRCEQTAKISRLFAAGMDSKQGVSFDGKSYSSGRPAKAEIGAPWNDEFVRVGGYRNSFYIDVPYSSAVMVSMNCSSPESKAKAPDHV